MSFIYDFIASGTKALSGFAWQAASTLKLGAERIVNIATPIFPVLKNLATGLSHLSTQYTSFMKEREFQRKQPLRSLNFLYRPFDVEEASKLQMRSLTQPQGGILPKSKIFSRFQPPSFKNFSHPTVSPLNFSVVEGGKQFVAQLVNPLIRAQSELTPERQESAILASLENSSEEKVNDSSLGTSPLNSFSIESNETEEGAKPFLIASQSSPSLIEGEKTEMSSQNGCFSTTRSEGYQNSPLFRESIEKQLRDQITEQQLAPKEFLSLNVPALSKNRYLQSFSLLPSTIWTSSLAKAAGTPLNQHTQIDMTSGEARRAAQEENSTFSSNVSQGLINKTIEGDSLPSLGSIHYPSASLNFASFVQTRRLQVENPVTGKSSFVQPSTRLIGQAQQPTQGVRDRLSNSNREVSALKNPRIQLQRLDPEQKITVPLAITDHRLVSSESEHKKEETAIGRSTLLTQVEISEEIVKKAREQAVLNSQVKVSVERALHSQAQEEATRKREEGDRKREDAYKRAHYKSKNIPTILSQKKPVTKYPKIA